jgi:hypothetical protein
MGNPAEMSLRRVVDPRLLGVLAIASGIDRNSGDFY